VPRKQDEYLEPERGETDTRTQDWDPFQRVRGRRFIVHTLFEEKIWVQNKMPETNVNRLAREIEEASANAKKLYNEHHAPRMYGWPSLAAQTASWNRYLKAHKRARNMIEKLKTMNQNAFQVQLAKIENQRKNLNKNLNKAMEGYGFGNRNLIENVFREYAHWNVNDPKKRANKIRNLTAKIEGLPNATIYNKYKKAIAPIALKFARVRRNENALKKAVAMRKKHIGPEKPARNRFRSIVAQKVLPPIVQNINYAPYGRKTLSPMRRFPGYKDPTLEEYARARREINRLQRELKRKRNNNNRN